MKTPVVEEDKPKIVKMVINLTGYSKKEIEISSDGEIVVYPIIRRGLSKKESGIAWGYVTTLIKDGTEYIKLKRWGE